MTREPREPYFPPAPDPFPLDTRRRMLCALASMNGSQRRIDIERKAFGETGFMAVWAINAMKALLRDGYVSKRVPGGLNGRYELTEKGRLEAAALPGFHPEVSA